jgi:tetratricopeptide (TPR) repeat protein
VTTETAPSTWVRNVVLACAAALAVLLPLFCVAVLGATAQWRHLRHECARLVSDDELWSMTGAGYTPGPQSGDSATGCSAEWIGPAGETSVERVTLSASADQQEPAAMVAGLQDRSLEVRSLKLGDWAVVGEGDGVATAYVSSCGVLLTVEAEGTSGADRIAAITAAATGRFERLCKFASPWPVGVPWARRVKYEGSAPAVPAAMDPAQQSAKEAALSERAATDMNAHRYDVAARELEHALRLHTVFAAGDDPEAAALLRRLGVAYRHLRRVDESEKVLRRALAIVEPGDDFRATAKVLDQLGQTMVDAGDARQGLELSLRALALHDRHRTGARDDDRVTILGSLASAYGDLGDHKNEAKLADKVLKAEEAADPTSATAANAMNNLALAYRDGNRVKESIPLFERSLKLQARLLGADSPELIPTLNGLAGAYYFNDNLVPAEAVARRALDIGAANGMDPDEVTTSVLSDIVAERGDYAEAVRWLDQSFERLQQIVPQGTPETLRTRIKRSVALAAIGRDEESREDEREAVALASKMYGGGTEETIAAMSWLARDLEAVAGADRAKGLRSRIVRQKNAVSRR